MIIKIARHLLIHLSNSVQPTQNTDESEHVLIDSVHTKSKLARPPT